MRVVCHTVVCVCSRVQQGADMQRHTAHQHCCIWVCVVVAACLGEGLHMAACAPQHELQLSKFVCVFLTLSRQARLSHMAHS